jgi:hypothetical protein
LQVDRVARSDVRKIGLVGQQDYGFMSGDGPESAIDVNAVENRIVDPGDPEPGTAAFQRHCFIAQYPNACGRKRIGNARRVGSPVVIAKHGENTQRST